MQQPFRLLWPVEIEHELSEVLLTMSGVVEWQVRLLSNPKKDGFPPLDEGHW